VRENSIHGINLVVEKDGQDPQFLANLGRLGQVKVDHHMETKRTSVRSLPLQKDSYEVSYVFIAGQSHQ
jgi:hypothetical protein